jgi:hypothetical protein
MAYQARFFDISCIINPDYTASGYITSDMLPGMEKRIQDYVTAARLNLGDVLFVGSTYDTRQEYGFYMVLPGKSGQPVATASEYAVGLPQRSEIGAALAKAQVKFNLLFRELSESEEFKFLFFPDDEDEKTELVNIYTGLHLL